MEISYLNQESFQNYSSYKLSLCSSPCYKIWCPRALKPTSEMCIYSYLNTAKQTSNTSVNLTYQGLMASNDLSLQALSYPLLFPKADLPSWSGLPLLQSLLLLLHTQVFALLLARRIFIHKFMSSPFSLLSSSLFNSLFCAPITLI